MKLIDLLIKKLAKEKINVCSHELMAKTGISTQAFYYMIRSIKNGKYVPKNKTIARIATYLGISIEESFNLLK